MRRLVRLAVGGLLMASGWVLFLVMATYALTIGLLITFSLVLPVLSIVAIGYALIADLTIKQFFRWLLSALFVMSIIWIAILPLEFKALAAALILTALGSLLYWRRHKIAGK
jgi:hypothetical protein